MTRSLSLALLASLLLASPPARAQVDHLPPDPRAPRGTVSHINGYPVKVGEHHEYIYELRRWNVSANPLGWIMGIYGISASYGFHDNAAVRADVTYYDPVGGGATATELSVGVPLYLRRTYAGVFLEPGLLLRRTPQDGGTERVFGPQVLVGWHWIWDSGFNVAVAGGVVRNLDGEEDEIHPSGYLRFGYSF